jgi:hypothetical protein
MWKNRNLDTASQWCCTSVPTALTPPCICMCTGLPHLHSGSTAAPAACAGCPGQCCNTCSAVALEGASLPALTYAHSDPQSPVMNDSYQLHSHQPPVFPHLGARLSSGRSFSGACTTQQTVSLLSSSLSHSRALLSLHVLLSASAAGVIKHCLLRHLSA